MAGVTHFVMALSVHLVSLRCTKTAHYACTIRTPAHSAVSDNIVRSATTFRTPHPLPRQQLRRLAAHIPRPDQRDPTVSPPGPSSVSRDQNCLKDR